MTGTYYRLMQDKNLAFGCWRVRDELEHLCIMEAKSAVCEIDPPMMDALKKSRPHQKKFTAAKQTIDEVIHRVIEKYEPGILTMQWLRRWLEWYIPAWRASILYPRSLPTPRVEHLGVAEPEEGDEGLTGYHIVKNQSGTVIERFSDRLIRVETPVLWHEIRV